MSGDPRDGQRFPTLAADEIERAARFGERRPFAAGEALFRTGAVGMIMPLPTDLGSRRYIGTALVRFS